MRVPRGCNPDQEDGLCSIPSQAFAQDPDFHSAYQRGIAATNGQDYHWRWRVHVGLWCARQAVQLAGDFIECGVNRGFMASAIMHALKWDETGKMFYLFDTFAGPPREQLAKTGRLSGHIERARGFYMGDSHEAVRNFSEWSNVRIIHGVVPGTLTQRLSVPVAFLHLDMNCARPEVAALHYFWPLLTKGAFVLLDDYAYRGYEPQRVALDLAANELHTTILSLPTGQGLIQRH